MLILVISCGGISGYFYFLHCIFSNFQISAINVWLYSERKSQLFLRHPQVYACTVSPRLCENLYIYKKKKGLETRVPRGTLSRPGRRCEILRFLIFICILLGFPNSLLSGCFVICLGKGEKGKIVTLLKMKF